MFATLFRQPLVIHFHRTISFWGNADFSVKSFEEGILQNIVYVVSGRKLQWHCHEALLNFASSLPRIYFRFEIR